MRISDWSSDVCSSDLAQTIPELEIQPLRQRPARCVLANGVEGRSTLPFGARCGHPEEKHDRDDGLCGQQRRRAPQPANSPLARMQPSAELQRSPQPAVNGEGEAVAEEDRERPAREN